MHDNTASKIKVRNLESVNSIEDDILYHKMRSKPSKLSKLRSSKLNLLEAMREESDVSVPNSKETNEHTHQQKIEANPDCSFVSFKCQNNTPNAPIAPPYESFDSANNESIMTFKDFQGHARKSPTKVFNKKPELDLSLDTLNSTNVVIEPLSPKFRPRKDKSQKLEEILDKSDIGELKPVNVFHCVGSTYKLDVVKQNLSGMLGKLSRY